MEYDQKPYCLYSTLGLNRSRETTNEDIRTAYKRLCLLYHPDKNKSDDAHSKFLKIQEAYQILGDETRRREYDALIELESSCQANSENAELFKLLMNLLSTQLDLFLKKAKQAKAPEANKTDLKAPPDIHLSIEASLEDIYKGATKKLQIKVLRDNAMTPIYMGIKLTDIWEPAIFDKAGDNCLADVIVTVQPQKHDMFMLDEIMKTYDISTELPISLAELYIGYDKSIEYLDGTQLKIHRDGGEPGKLMLRLDGYGLPYDDGTCRGNLYVFFYLTLPKQLVVDSTTQPFLEEYFRMPEEHAKIERSRITSYASS